MRIVIDMQGAQTISRLRGIGRYTLSLTHAIVRNRGRHEIILALSGLLPDTIAPIRASFDGLLAPENIRVWHAPAPLRAQDPDNACRYEAAELVREAFLASLQPDAVLVSSLFEGYIDDAVTGIGRFDRSTPVGVIFYDLIPLLNPDQYLKPDAVYERFYRSKIEYLQRATLLLAISESSRQEAITHLGMPPESVATISSSVDAHFRPISIADEQKEAIQSKHGISRPFLMYTGAADSRKNVEGLIRAYATLPQNLRARHQLVVAGFMYPHSRLQIEALGKALQLGDDELLLTGFVPDDELLLLYNLCKAFVFPSWHEGFGLPALEAMACGRAVIASNTSSLPEVIGREDALFDPHSTASIAEKIERVLTDDAFRTALESHGLERAQHFSWNFSARRAIAALENCHARHSAKSAALDVPSRKPSLAYVSPLPPERTGIANYSAELLPALRRHFDITLITNQARVDLPAVIADLPVHSAEWFDAHARNFDRIIYQFGNSPYHRHMLGLLQRHPGVVTLHDFFLSSLLAEAELSEAIPGIWTQSLYRSHGYRAMLDRFGAQGFEHARSLYPCNLDILQTATGIIVHSRHSKRLAEHWYGAQAAGNWHLVPHLRMPPAIHDRVAARKTLEIGEDKFVVCSFGFIDPTKLNHRLLDAWLASSLSANPSCELVLVGANHGGDYGARLIERIQSSAHRERIHITGWADMALYERYLQAADLAVQLRNMSRGETSGAVLDCLNHGLPTIVNAHGSMADLPDDATWKLADNFSDAELVTALETLWRDAVRRDAISRQALDIISTRHAPAYCAALYAAAIETFHSQAATNLAALTSALAKSAPDPMSDQVLLETARTVSQSIAESPRQAQLLVDVSKLIDRDEQTGDADLVRPVLQAWLSNPPPGFRVEPVYASVDHGYRYARQFTLDFLGGPANGLRDEAIEVQAGDCFVAPDLQQDFAQPIYQWMQRQGVRVQGIAQDLPPISIPQALNQLLVDVSAISRNDLQTGIERVVRAQLSQLLRNPPPGFSVEPVYLSDEGGMPHYRYAQRYAHRVLAIEAGAAEELPVTIRSGDIFYGADFCPSDVIKAGAAGIYAGWRNIGAQVSFLIHDILPISRPDFFPDQADRQHAQWLACIAGNADTLLCISQAVADEVASRIKPVPPSSPTIRVLHHGADIAASCPSLGLPENGAHMLGDMKSVPSFLMVGTIEPRKGHVQALAAFEQLWKDGSPAKLVIVGKEGWTALEPQQRRGIPGLVEKLTHHPELGKRLLWLSNISDEYLQQVYAACTCLIFASEAEGFGLPLIEAARFERPIIARDIPVFREIAQEHAFYFSGLKPADLATAVTNWLTLHAHGKAPTSAGMRWNTWAQNVEQLTAILTDGVAAAGHPAN